MSSDPLHGTVTTDEFITNNASRVLYVPDNDQFSSTDSFQVIPQDGFTTGSPATITLNTESLPVNSTSTNPDSANVTTWGMVGGNSIALRSYTETLPVPGNPVSAIYLKSVNMEGSHLAFETASDSYTVAIPDSGDRMINFTAPLNIISAVLHTDGPEEEAFYNNTRDNPSTDVSLFVGYDEVVDPCRATDGSGANICVNSTYTAISRPGLAIPDNTDAHDTADTLTVPVNGTLNEISVSVDITHTYIGDLQVVLTSPGGTETILHDKTGGSSNDIQTTYSSASHDGLASLAGSMISGDWTLSVGDYAGGDIGTLNSWNLTLNYTAPAYVPPPVNMTQTPEAMILFSDDFQATTLTGNWDETGEGEWDTSTPRAHSVPDVPNGQTPNKCCTRMTATSRAYSPSRRR